ncbi:hypothetical protein BH23ACT12_BH23ACT12_07980 [soil metagenome]
MRDARIDSDFDLPDLGPFKWRIGYGEVAINGFLDVVESLIFVASLHQQPGNPGTETATPSSD